MSAFSFARRRASRVPSAYAMLVVVILLSFSALASAQHTADQQPPKVVPGKKRAVSAKAVVKPDLRPRYAGTKRVVARDAQPVSQPDGSIVGIPVEYERGIPVTMAQLMEDQAEADKLGPPDFKGASGKPARMNHERRNNPQNPEAPEGPTWPMVDTGSADQTTHKILDPQTIGTNYTSATVLGTNPTLSLPPDSMGAVGPTQHITAVNGRIVSFNKTTGVADGVMNLTEDVFFSSVRNGAGTSDPRIRYDRLSSRWFLIIINVSTPNRVLIAVSDTSTITGATVWTFFFIPIDTTPPAISSTCLFDYCTLGIDANALYIGGNNFCGSPQVFTSTDGFVVRKSSITGGGPIVVTAFRGLVPTAGGAGPYTPQGVDNYDPAATEGYFIGVDNATFGTLMLRRVSTPAGTPTISGNISITTTATQFPVLVPHLGNDIPTTGRLDSLDDRLFAAHIRNGRLWTAHNIGVNNTGTTTGTRTRNAARWYELQNIASPGTPTVLQSGTVFDPTAPNNANQLNYWIPSIMVSGQGHAAMAFSRAGAAVRADVYTCGRLSIDSLNTMRAVTAITASTTDYSPGFDTGAGRGSRRWG